MKDISEKVINYTIEKSFTVQENENSFDIKYKKFTDRKDKSQFLTKIQSDLLNNYTNISKVELSILSYNLYDFCCLMINHVSKDEITKYISYKNSYYNKNLSDEDIEKFIDIDYIKLKSISQKYIKLLKNNY